MDENITIYTTPGCPGCALTRRKLDKAGITYHHIDLSQRPDLIERFKQEGLLSAPIIEAQEERTSGFNPDRIRAIIALADPGPTQTATNPTSQPETHPTTPTQTQAHHRR